MLQNPTSGLACIFAGYSADHMAYGLWDPSTCKVELARDVLFFAKVFPAAGDRSDTQELSFDVISSPEEGSQQRADSADGSAPSNPTESILDNAEHFVELPAIGNNSHKCRKGMGRPGIEPGTSWNCTYSNKTRQCQQGL
jgi:hypothetical protein